MYALDDYDYRLPERFIAQAPCGTRERSRLLRLDRRTGAVAHHRFYEIADMLDAGDLLVINNTRVVPARLLGKKPTGGRVEVLILDYPGEKVPAEGGEAVRCRCLVKASKRPRPGSRLLFDLGLTAEVVSVSDMEVTLVFFCDSGLERVLEKIGRVPLPHYIHAEDGGLRSEHRRRYQTVYASQSGAVAAPTAGLHFSDALLTTLRDRGVQVAEITLHVGYGTFSPVRTSDIRRHRMHAERFSVSAEAAAAVNAVKKRHGRVVATGTTCVRTLEYAADENGVLRKAAGQCDSFIYPGYRFKVVDAIITNFHLPRSTLLMLVSAFAGRDRILAAYEIAKASGYRFYSYGDAMLII